MSVFLLVLLGIYHEVTQVTSILMTKLCFILFL